MKLFGERLLRGAVAGPLQLRQLAKIFRNVSDERPRLVIRRDRVALQDRRAGFLLQRIQERGIDFIRIGQAVRLLVCRNRGLQIGAIAAVDFARREMRLVEQHLHANKERFGHRVVGFAGPCIFDRLHDIGGSSIVIE